MYLAGVSVRRGEDISEALWGSKVSPVQLPAEIKFEQLQSVIEELKQAERTKAIYEKSNKPVVKAAPLWGSL